MRQPQGIARHVRPVVIDLLPKEVGFPTIGRSRGEIRAFTSIGQASASGINAKMIRHYESVGLIGLATAAMASPTCEKNYA